MLTKALIILILNLTLPIYHSTIFLQTSDCKKYKKGSFYFSASIYNTAHYYSIKRNDTAQIEKDLVTNELSKYKIKWVNDCTYTLQFIDGSVALTADQLHSRKSMIITTSIISGTDKYYLFHTINNKNTINITDTMWIANKQPVLNSNVL